MRRREFIAGIGSAAAWPLAAGAQQPARPVIGYVSTITPEADATLLNAFRRALRETGFVEGQNVAMNTGGRKAASIGCQDRDRHRLRSLNGVGTHK